MIRVPSTIIRRLARLCALIASARKRRGYLVLLKSDTGDLIGPADAIGERRNL